MQRLQNELATDHPEFAFQLLGVNEFGEEADNAEMCAARDIDGDGVEDSIDLPWLQDTEEVLVWEAWAVAPNPGVTYRDLFLLNEENVTVVIYNLTEHNITTPAGYEELRGVVLEILGAP